MTRVRGGVAAGRARLGAPVVVPVVVLVIVLVVVLAGCSQPAREAAGPSGPSGLAASTAPPAAPAPTGLSTPAAPEAPATPATPETPTATPEPGTVPPAWLGTRVLPVTATGYGEVRPTPPALRVRRFTLPDTVAALPGDGYASRVVSPAPARVLARSTWSAGCPVGRDQLAWVRVAFRGFDGARHSGELLVAAGAAADLVEVFRRLWAADFPLEQVAIATRAELDAAPTGDGNATGAFVCRAVTGGSSYSQHAYGLAVDVNPFQNPYERGATVLPELASAYLDRDDERPGMILAGGPVVAAFAAVGWEWGGDYRSLKDYQHFSRDGG